MAIHYRTLGFVIKKKDTGEADRIFTIFTQDFGKIKVLGRAIRKITSKLRGGIDILSFSDIEFIQGKTHKTLTESLIINRFSNIKGHFGKFKIAHKIAGAIDNLIKGQEHDKEIWDLLNEIFLKLETEDLNSKNYHLFYNYFIWNFFSILGYKPELYKCVVCQKKLNPASIYFSSKEGGAVCQNCREKYKRINADIIKVLRIILKKDWNTLSKLIIKPFSKKLIQDITKDYYFYLLSDFQKNSKVI